MSMALDIFGTLFVMALFYCISFVMLGGTNHYAAGDLCFAFFLLMACIGIVSGALWIALAIIHWWPFP